MTPRTFKPSARTITLVLALASLFSLSLALWAVFPRLSASEQLAHGHSGPVEMPWRFSEVSNGNQLSVHLAVNWLTPRRWNITPDDRLTALRINGQAVPLDRVPAGGLSDWRNGFAIDLSPWLHRGDNQLDFTVDNYYLNGGIVLHPLAGWRVLLLAGGLLPWLLALSRMFRLRRSQTLILGGALLLMGLYWAATPWTLRNHDVGYYGGTETGHLAYVGYVAEHLALPRPDLGWEYFQPPLYYAVGALAWRWAQWLNLPPAEALQALALAFWLVFLAASAATLRLSLRRSPALLGLATAALALWPSGIMHGLRLGNDPPMYAAAAVATWWMVRWWRSGRDRHVYGMALAIAVALLCKTNAIALLAAASGLLVLRLLASPKRRRVWVQAATASAIMAGGVLLSLFRGLWYWWHGQIPSWLIANIGLLDSSLRVPNQIRYFLPLDIPVFLTSPWADTRDDATGRANVWNFLLRSSLSGEFQFDGALKRRIALAWGVLLLWLLGLLLLRLSQLRFSPAKLWREMPLSVLSLSWLASLLAVRIEYPFACKADFRFVLPLLLPFLIACVRSGVLARSLLLLLSLGSGVFFIALQ
ncbi:MAG TPA: hypothetical protein VNX47_05235 [Nevskia sp.]|nr:hypothetical protein [Nevskia sp.]